MQQHIAHIGFLVREYAEAIAFFTRVLDFQLVSDTQYPEENKRWVIVAPPNSSGANLVLSRPRTEEQRKSIGKQAAGRVFLFLATDDFERDYRKYVERGVKFVRPPRNEPYGTVAVFEDLYGNYWDLLQHKFTDDKPTGER